MYFATSASHKFQEARLLIPELRQLALELPELQSSTLQEVAQGKLAAARQQTQEDVVIEDIGLFLDALDGLPGPFVKWFLLTMGSSKLFSVAQTLGNVRATEKTVVGLARNKQFFFFEGEVQGSLVAPSGQESFGWDHIFQPDGHAVTYAEMSKEEKNEISARSIAFRKLVAFLEAPQ